ncbi:multiple zinc ribbon protein [Acidovorax phage AP1]|nr:multiple zinc ribbon protein [Acidovorax phage AP1]
MSYMEEANRIAAQIRGTGSARVHKGRRAADAPSTRNLEVLDFCKEFFRENDQIPPGLSISRHFGWSSLNAAQIHIDALIRHGLLERNAVGKLRFARKEVAHG